MNVPGSAALLTPDADAFNCVALRAVPAGMAAGVAPSQKRVCACVTVQADHAADGFCRWCCRKGVNVTESVWEPAVSTVPADGL